MIKGKGLLKVKPEKLKLIPKLQSVKRQRNEIEKESTKRYLSRPSHYQYHYRYTIISAEPIDDLVYFYKRVRENKSGIKSKVGKKVEVRRQTAKRLRKNEFKLNHYQMPTMVVLNGQSDRLLYNLFK
jgi:hypothetical protein